MSLIDLLRMSTGNLKRRKLRTFLTVLGVVIGTASIVVMISLGLGLQQSLYQEVEQSGGLTTLTVSGQNPDSSMAEYSYSEAGDSGMDSGENLYITDETIQEFSQLPHVRLVSPMYEIYAYALKGKYYAPLDIVATTPEQLKDMNIKMKPGGQYPEENGNNLEFIFGNWVIHEFVERKTGNGYWETGEYADVDLEHDQMFLILNTEAYSPESEGTRMMGDEGTEGTKQAANSHIILGCGMVEGDPDSYNAHAYYAYCDLQTLKKTLKKEFGSNPIPGQPTTKSGKPYKFFAYTSAKVRVEDMKYVDEVSETLRTMGYRVDSNVEYMESMKKEFALIQAVLGGIGAVSLLVAAIGIANTMMMSIYERTKEIGVIKVLGCSLKNIRQMFLMEAAFIGLMGGVIGNILSLSISAVINIITGNMSGMADMGGISYIPVWLLAVSIGFAVLVGMAAGYFPALRAMKLSPLAAIRNE